MRLMDQQSILPGVVQKTWLHGDGAGHDNISFEIVQDAAPIIASIQRDAQAQNSQTDMPLAARIPVVVVQDTAKRCGEVWGVRMHEAYREITQAKSDRAKKVWDALIQGRDYRKLQTRHYV